MNILIKKIDLIEEIQELRYRDAVSKVCNFLYSQTDDDTVRRFFINYPSMITGAFPLYGEDKWAELFWEAHQDFVRHLETFSKPTAHYGKKFHAAVPRKEMERLVTILEVKFISNK